MPTPDRVRKYFRNAKPNIEDVYKDVTAHPISRFVLIGSWFAMWIPLAEIIGRAANIPMMPVASGSVLYCLMSLLPWIAAAVLVYLSLNLSCAVVEKERDCGPKKQLEEPRYIAYAWSCGLIGMAILSAEVFGILDLRFEDPLLGMAGLNTLVEEVRLRIAEAGGSTIRWVGKPPRKV